VGIGTTAPASVLTVAGGNADVTNGIAQFTNSSFTALQEFTHLVVGRSAAINQSALFGYNEQVPAKPFAYMGVWGCDVNSQTLNISQAGNVGIGTSTPKSTLKVEGSIAGKFVETNAAYTCTSKDYFVFATSGGIVITLPLANSVDAGSVIIIRNYSPGIVGVQRQGADMLYLLGNLAAQPGAALPCPGGGCGAGSPVGRFISDGVSKWIEW